MSNHDCERAIWLSSLATFLFFAIALIVPSGYSLGAALLFLAALYTCRRTALHRLELEDRLIVFALAIFFVSYGLGALLNNLNGGEFDKSSRFLFAALTLPFLRVFSPKPGCFWSGLAIGAISAGMFASWQVLVEGEYRAGGFMNMIQFGNISILFGLLCLSGMGWVIMLPHNGKFFWLMLLIAGVILGVTGSILSGSRGSWLALPLAVGMICYGFADQLKRSQTVLVCITAISIIVGVCFIPQTGIQERVSLAVRETAAYFDSGDASSSVGARFELWRAAYHIGMEKPLLGWSDKEAYQQEKARWVEQGWLDSFIIPFSHPHNDFLYVWVRRGLLGVASLLMLYILPLWLFIKEFRSVDGEIRCYAISGVVLVLSYMTFGLTNATFIHNGGVMVYSFSLIIIWSLFQKARKNSGERLSHY